MRGANCGKAINFLQPVFIGYMATLVVQTGDRQTNWRTGEETDGS